MLRWIGNAGCCPPSCSKWVVLPIYARCWNPASRSILMGPTGTPTETPARRRFFWWAAVSVTLFLFSIGQGLRANGSRVVYFAGYKKIIDRYKVEEIEAAADVVIWVLR